MERAASKRTACACAASLGLAAGLLSLIVALVLYFEVRGGSAGRRKGWKGWSWAR